jgi:hypothetical protein
MYLIIINHHFFCYTKANQFFVYCNYVGGQTKYEKPYELGKPCSKCPNSKCVNNLCHCDKACQNGGTLDLSTCSCICPGYTSGSECEQILCTQSDKELGCWTRNANDCRYSNIPPICPNLCKMCLLS